MQHRSGRHRPARGNTPAQGASPVYERYNNQKPCKGAIKKNKNGTVNSKKLPPHCVQHQIS